MSAVEAVIFDLGNVLLLFDWEIAADRLCTRTGRTRRELDDYVLSTPFVSQLSIGTLSKRKFFEIVSKDLGFDGSYEEFAELWSDIFTPNEPMLALAAALRGRMTRLILSNTNAIHMDFVFAKFPYLRDFDGHIFSHEVGLMKPDLRIYDLAMRKFGLTAGRTVFIDDIGAHVEGAQAAGMHGIHYESPDQVRRELTKLGLPPI